MLKAVKVPYDQITAQSTLDVMSGTNEIDVFQYWYVDKEALVRDGVLADITDRIAAEEADIDPRRLPRRALRCLYRGGRPPLRPALRRRHPRSLL